MNKFNSEEIVRIIDALNGGITPVGETNADECSYANLKNLETIIYCLLDDIQFLITSRNSYEYSVKRIGNEAINYLIDVRNRINDWLKEYEGE